jgi:hypothetical protein
MARIDPHSYFDTDQPRTKHVRLRWQVDFHTRQLTGTATLMFETPSSGMVDLDSKGLTITSVQAPTGRHIPYALGADEPILGRKLQLQLPAQTSEVTIAYRTSPEALAQQWLYETGMPPNAPVFTSAKLEELRALAQAWTAGTRPTPAQLQQWSPLEVLVFLQHLPRDLDHASLAWLDAQLHLTGRGNYEIVVEWLTIAAGSDYEPVFGRIREVLTQVGRMKFLRPLFVALGKHARTQQLGREIYDTARATYHSLSRRVIEAVMVQWATP